MVSLKDCSYSILSRGVVRGLLFFLDIPFKLFLAADINYQYLIDSVHEEEYAASFTLSFPISFFI